MAIHKIQNFHRSRFGVSGQKKDRRELRHDARTVGRSCASATANSTLLQQVDPRLYGLYHPIDLPALGQPDGTADDDRRRAPRPAHQVVAVMPTSAGRARTARTVPARTDRRKLVANMLMAAGVDRVMTMDLHADQIQGFFDVPVDALYASGIFVPYIKSLNIEDLSIAAPDMGGAKRANTYSKLLGTPISISHKERAKANVVGKMTAIGDVEGRNVLIVDDMIDTAGTICMAADMLMSRGAKSVRAAITHPVLSGPAYERINESALEGGDRDGHHSAQPRQGPAQIHRPVGRRPLRRRHRARAQLQGDFVDLLQIGEPASNQKNSPEPLWKGSRNFPAHGEGLLRLLSALGAAADILRGQASDAPPAEKRVPRKGCKKARTFRKFRPLSSDFRLLERRIRLAGHHQIEHPVEERRGELLDEVRGAPLAPSGRGVCAGGCPSPRCGPPPRGSSSSTRCAAWRPAASRRP